MNILIIGNGSYVLNDNYGKGVILRSIIQWNRINSCLLPDVYVCERGCDSFYKNSKNIF